MPLSTTGLPGSSSMIASAAVVDEPQRLVVLERFDDAGLDLERRSAVRDQRARRTRARALRRDSYLASRPRGSTAAAIALVRSSGGPSPLEHDAARNATKTSAGTSSSDRCIRVQSSARAVHQTLRGNTPLGMQWARVYAFHGAPGGTSDSPRGRRRQCDCWRASWVRCLLLGSRRRTRCATSRTRSSRCRWRDRSSSTCRSARRGRA